ncbi:MAG TPA: spore protease YyaC [Peptococcaceae bacterium]|nr:spore protease YyaC [Peptococcaceae bacterium]
MKPLYLFREKQDIRGHYQDELGLANLQKKLSKYILAAEGKQVILLCIGTDRSTGDSLGPLTGTKIKEKCIPGLCVIGTLENPVHAENLRSTLKEIYKAYSNPYIVALDACLGRLDSVGYITLAEGPLKPGTAVKKDLPAVGDIHLTGIVNVDGLMQYVVLQNTRLNLVWQMSEAICRIFYRTYLGNVAVKR